MKKHLYVIAALFLAASITLSACSKNEGGTSTLHVRMTDAPAAFSKVNVEINEVLVKMNDDTTSASGWIRLDTRAGVYDLLTLQNNRDTLLASATIPHGSLKQIRLVLGSDNSVEVLGVTYPLTIPSGSESGLKIKLNQAIDANFETVLIDFDANASVRLETDGSYKLRPVITVR